MHASSEAAKTAEQREHLGSGRRRRLQPPRQARQRAAEHIPPLRLPRRPGLRSCRATAAERLAGVTRSAAKRDVYRLL